MKPLDHVRAVLVQAAGWMQVLHRLDMDTTGVMLFAKEQHVVAAMHAQFRSRTVSKTYAAICLGSPSLSGALQRRRAAPPGTADGLMWDIDLPLGRHPSIAAAGCVSDSGKAARTCMLLREENGSIAWPASAPGEAWFQPADQVMDGACFLECAPVTGKLTRPAC